MLLVIYKLKRFLIAANNDLENVPSLTYATAKLKERRFKRKAWYGY
jgi:hypothetical protein